MKKNKIEMTEMYTHIVTLEEPLSILAEAYRRVKVGLEYSEVDKKIQVIQVCSSLQGEGKTTTVLNLAATYAESKKKVIVLDLDFRRPKLHRAFYLPNEKGITDVLTGNITINDAIKHSDKLPFDLINRGTKTPYPTALLGSKELEKVMNQLREMYDVILVDCPPILAVSDAVVISKYTDGCLVIVSQKLTEKTAAKEAIKLLKNNNVNLLGSIVTGISRKDKSGYGNSRYHYYYQDYSESNE